MIISDQFSLMNQIVFTSLLLCFGAGVLLCTALLHIMPEVAIIFITIKIIIITIIIKPNIIMITINSLFMAMAIIILNCHHSLSTVIAKVAITPQVREGLEAHGKSLGVSIPLILKISVTLKRPFLPY